MKKLVIILVFSIPVISLYASENTAHYEELFIKANEKYTEGEFGEALEIYKQIADAGFESGILLFNTGNACYKLNLIPEAILYYEKARRIIPDDPDIEFNLQIANQRITDKIEPIPEFFVYGFMKKLNRMFAVDGWAYRSLILILFACISAGVYFFAGAVFFRKLSFFLSLICLSAGITCYYNAVVQKTGSTHSDEAIVLTPTVTVKSSPDENSTQLFVIHEGLKVKMLEEVNDWYKISLLDGTIGWLKKKEVKVI